MCLRKPGGDNSAHPTIFKETNSEKGGKVQGMQATVVHWQAKKGEGEMVGTAI